MVCREMPFSAAPAAPVSEAEVGDVISSLRQNRYVFIHAGPVHPLEIVSFDCRAARHTRAALLSAIGQDSCSGGVRFPSVHVEPPSRPGGKEFTMLMTGIAPPSFLISGPPRSESSYLVLVVVTGVD